MRGSIQKKGKVYYAVIPINGKRKWFKGGTKKDAERVLGEKLHEIQGDTYREIRKITFKEYADQWVKSVEAQLKPSTVAVYKHLIDKKLKPAFEYRLVSDLNPAMLERYKAERLREVSAKTVVNEITLLKLMCKQAVKLQYVKIDPAIYLERPRVQKVDIEILEMSEVQRLLDNADSLYRVAFLTAILTGVRAGELWAVRWSDLDQKTKKLHIRRSVWKGKFQTPKTKNAIRAIDVTDDLLKELRIWKLACPINEHDLMFPSREGNITDHDNAVKRYFLPALRRAGLRAVSFHSMRHTNASLRIQAGQNIKYLSSQLGHASVNMSLDVYGHLFRDEVFQRQQVDLLQTTFKDSVRKPLEIPLQNAEKGLTVSANPL